MSKICMTACVTGAVFAIDQLSKWAALEVLSQPPHVIKITTFFNLSLGFNTGISFGLFDTTMALHQDVLIVVKLAIVGALLIGAILSSERLQRVGLSLMAGGALGNIADRWYQGAVTDFLDVHWRGWHWPTFNGADMFIVIGALLVVAIPIASTRSPTGEVS